MTPFEIWRKIIKSPIKIYSKAEVTKRVNVVYAVGQLSDEEYTELIQLIETVYGEAA